MGQGSRRGPRPEQWTSARPAGYLTPVDQRKDLHVRRLTSIALTLLLVLGLAAGMVSPQVSAQGSGTTGEAVSILDAAGQPLLELSVDSFTPDFQGYDRSYAPDRGFEYAHITVTMTNVGQGPFSINSYGFRLIDTEGFASDSAFVAIDETAAPEMLDSSPLEPGDSRSGSIVFMVLAGTEAAAITYSVTYERLSFLASSATAPAFGDPVDLLDSNAQPTGVVTVEEWLDPLPDLDPSSQPNRGYHYAGALVTIENTGDSILPVDPYSFTMIDADGYQNFATSAYRPSSETPDLEYADLAPGESMTGLVTFQVFNSSTPAMIVHDENDRFSLLATFDEAPAVPALTDLPTVDAIYSGPAPDDGDTSDDSSDDTADEPAEEVSEDCQALEDWILGIFAQLDENEALADFDIESAADMSVEELEAARDALEDVLDDLEGEEAPSLGVEFLDTLIAFIEYMIDGLDQIIEAAENGDDVQAAVDEVTSDEDAINGYFAAFESISAECANLA